MPSNFLLFFVCLLGFFSVSGYRVSKMHIKIPFIEFYFFKLHFVFCCISILILHIQESNRLVYSGMNLKLVILTLLMPIFEGGLKIFNKMSLKIS